MPTNVTVERAVFLWGDTFKRWARPFSETEETKADNAANVIRSALKDHPALANVNFEVYATGSYHNNTNVRGESDIDVAAVCHEAFFWESPPGAAPQGLSFSPAPYGFVQFRTDVERALTLRFGAGMAPGDKAFNIHENTYRIEADVTPFLEYRRYKLVAGSWTFDEGVQSVSKSGYSFVNWHKDHYSQGVRRNTETRKRFKRVARILKNTKFDMLERGTAAAKAAAKSIPSFLIECLAFNCPDSCFNLSVDGYVHDVRAVITELWNATTPEGRWSNMVEVNCQKWLFRGGQSWTREQVHVFLTEAWAHLFNE